MDKEKPHYIANQDELPELFPTHMHTRIFWEALGRAVASFGFLEEVLAKAIFALTATRSYKQEEIDQAFVKWLPTLERALTDSLSCLIDMYGKAIRQHQSATVSNLDEFLDNLRNAAKIRNVLCHGSWRAPNAAGASVPLFVNRQKEIFDTPVDAEYLAQVQMHTANLVCGVIDSVTHMGWQFPGSTGPGKEI